MEIHYLHFFFFFVLVIEVFNHLLSKAKEMDCIEGIIMGKEGVEISHLQFVNDT